MASETAKLRLETIFRHLKPSIHKGVRLNETSSISSHFRYTLNNPFLSYAQRQSYEENGFLVIKKLVSDHLLDRYRDRFIDIANGRVQIPLLTVQKDISLLKDKSISGENLVYKLQDIFWDDVLFEYCRNPQILEYVECITGPNFMAMHTMLINKPPDSGTLSSRHPLHQDLHYFPFRPEDRIVCAWTAMERVNRQNGCLVAIPGSHKGELLHHGYPDWEDGVNKFYHGIKEFSQEMPRVYLEMEKGDTVFFHPLLIHGSGANKTKGFRKAISCHYAASECHYIDVQGTSQEILAEEILELARRRGIQINDFREVWKLRGQLIKGERITL